MAIDGLSVVGDIGEDGKRGQYARVESEFVVLFGDESLPPCEL